MKSSQWILIYDGHCPFCTEQASWLNSVAGHRIQLESFQEPAVLARYPALTHDECMKEIKLITPEGKILGGAHAIFQAVSLQPALGFLVWIYRIPGIRQISNGVYRIIAKRRYQIQGRKCPDGTCRLHLF